MITITDIQSMLGEDSSSLPELSTSPKVNKWSFNKPVYSIKCTELTDNDRAAVDYGWTVRSYTNPFDLIHDWSQDSAWTYSAPAAPYRMLDFNGYDKNATAPWQVETSADSVRKGSSVKLNTTTDLQSATQLHQFAGPKNSQDSWEAGFLLVNGTPTTNTASCIYYKVCSWPDVGSFDGLPVSTTSLEVSSYTPILVLRTSSSYSNGSTVQLTAGNYDNDGADWLTFPKHSTVIKVTEAVSPPRDNSIQWSTADVVSQVSDYRLQSLSFSLTASLDSASTENKQIQVTVYLSAAGTVNNTRTALGTVYTVLSPGSQQTFSMSLPEETSVDYAEIPESGWPITIEGSVNNVEYTAELRAEE